MDNNYISTKKKRIKYSFPVSVEEFKSEPQKRNFSFFYQIATFSETYNDSKKYHMRKFVFDDKFNFVKIEEYRLGTKDCKKFYNRYPMHKYKQFDVVDLDDINPPSFHDLQTSISTNLNTNKESTSNLDSMYATFTNDNIDYRKIHRGQNQQGYDLSPLNNNVVTDFSNFN
jgi:hypothetical protein